MPRRFTLDEIALLGTDTDPVIAAILDRTEKSVSAKRLRLGIPCGRDIRWSGDMDATLGTDSDVFVARRLGLSETAVRSRREKLGIAQWAGSHRSVRVKWTQEQIALLGKFTDPTVARLTGRTWASVRKRRRKLGIAAGTINLVVCIGCGAEFETVHESGRLRCDQCWKVHETLRVRTNKSRAILMAHERALSGRVDSAE